MAHKMVALRLKLQYRLVASYKLKRHRLGHKMGVKNGGLGVKSTFDH